MPYLRTFLLLIPTPHKVLTVSCLCISLLVSLASGCSELNGTRLEKFIGKDKDLIDFSYEIAESLVDTSMPPLIPRDPDLPILVTTFVDNNDLTRTSKFGRILQEHISSRIVQLGYTVREIKLARTINIVPKSGETILSRDLTKISGEVKAQAILAGTISRSDHKLYMSARFISPDNSNIIATYDHQLYMDNNLLAMFGLQHQELEEPVAEPSRPSSFNLIFW